MTIDERDAIINGAIYKYGSNNQIQKAIEECAELIQALSKDLQGQGGTDFEILGEIADVTIMCHQLAIIYGLKEFDAVCDLKLQRLKMRLEQ